MTAEKQAIKTPDDDDILEGAIFTIKQTRYLKYAVIGMGILLVLGFLALAGTIMGKLSKKKPSPTQHSQTSPKNIPGTPFTAPLTGTLKPAITLPIPQNAVLKSYQLQGNRVILHIQEKQNNKLLVLNLETGKVESRIIIQKTHQ